MGFEREAPVQAQLNADCPTPSGLRCFYKARVSVDQGFLKVNILKAQASYVVSSLLEANAWAELEESQGEIKAGSFVNVYTLHHHLNREGLLSVFKSSCAGMVPGENMKKAHRVC